MAASKSQSIAADKEGQGEDLEGDEFELGGRRTTPIRFEGMAMEEEQLWLAAGPGSKEVRWVAGHQRLKDEWSMDVKGLN